MKKKLYIKGMSCQHCVMHVTNALKELDGVESVEINLDGKYGLVELSKGVDETTFNEALGNAGYDLVKVEDI